MSTEPLIDEEYASEEDSDFRSDGGVAGDVSENSDSEDDGEQPTAAAAAAATTSKRKRDLCADDADDTGYDNSGDEAIISKGKKRQKKAKVKDGATGDGDDEDDGGEGGLIKTRSMRAVENAERKMKAVTGPVTVDVDDLWAKMIAGPIMPSKSNAEKQNAAPTNAQEVTDEEADGARQEGKQSDAEPLSMIKIKRTYNFAGKVHTEEKMVPRDSAEAKVYLTSIGANADDVANADKDEPPRRQPRKAFRSLFEPIPEGLSQRTDLNLCMSVRLQMREQAKAKKLNVVEKSRMDWAGFVDKEGIKDELELAGKSKQSFASRQDFLARVEAKREDDTRRARMAGRM